jgi:hypothetical protein
MYGTRRALSVNAACSTSEPLANFFSTALRLGALARPYSGAP